MCLGAYLHALNYRLLYVLTLPIKIKKIIWKLSRSGSIIINGKNSRAIFTRLSYGYGIIVP